MDAESLKIAIINLHSELRGMDREQFNRYKRDLSLASHKKNAKHIELAHKGLLTFWIIAHKIDCESFTCAILDKEIPPVKLSSKEMELLSGGSGWESFADGFIKTITANGEMKGSESTVFYNSMATKKIA